MSSDTEAGLPEGWAAASLNEITTELQTGFACGTHNRGGDGVAHLRPMNVSERGCIELQEMRFVPRELVDRDERWLRKGDVLFNNTNSAELVGKTAYYDLDEPRAFSNHMTRIRFQAGALPQFYALLLHQRWREKVFQLQCNNHVSQASVSRRSLSELSVPVPPTAEQLRIVSTAGYLLERVSSAREHLECVLKKTRWFRDATLAAACSGRLTEEWRAGRGIVGPIEVTDEGLQYPRSWECKRTADIVQPGTVISYGIVLPGPNLIDGVPYIRGLDIDDAGRIHTGQLWKTSPEIAAKHTRSSLLAGDILLCVIRNLRVAVVPPGLDGANLTQGTVRLRPSPAILGAYLAHYLASPQAQGWMKERYVGTDMPRINVEHARSIPVPLPTLAEQHEIVSRLSELLALADRIQERTRAGLQRLEMLAQSILAKAFRGELVPTEAELARREGRAYEPASKLLARLRATPPLEAKPKRTRSRKRAQEEPPSDEDSLPQINR